MSAPFSSLLFTTSAAHRPLPISKMTVMPRHPHPTLLTIRPKSHSKEPPCLSSFCLRTPHTSNTRRTRRSLTSIHIHIPPNIQPPHPWAHLTHRCWWANNHLWCSFPRQIRQLTRREGIVHHIIVSILMLRCHCEPCCELVRRAVTVAVYRRCRLVGLVRFEWIMLEGALVGIHRRSQKG